MLIFRFSKKILLPMLLLCCLTFSAQAHDKGVADYKKGLKIFMTGDRAKSFPYFLEAAKQGNADAMYWVARSYRNNYGPPTANKYEPAAKWLQKGAELGSTRAMASLGNLYERGFIGYRDGGTGNSKAEHFRLAKKWFLKAGDAGEASGYSSIGTLYQTGQLIKVDDAKALYWFRKAAAMGYKYAMDRVIRLYGNGVPSDTEDAIQWFTKIANAGNTRAMIWLGDTFQSGNGIDQDYKTAMQWYHKAAAGGNAEGIARIGSLYLRGKGVKQDSKLALQWFNKAAAKGGANAMDEVGSAYLGNEGEKQYPKMAIKWYKKAIANGSFDASFHIYFMYLMGNGVPKDQEKAYLLMSKIIPPREKRSDEQDERMAQEIQQHQCKAECGDVDAMLWLAKHYSRRTNGKRDYKNSAYWYKKAAHLGNDYAMKELANMYRSGKGVKQDYSQAMLYYQMAAISNNSISMYYIGKMYKKGQGVTKNRDTAKRWLIRAAQHGRYVAILELRKLEENEVGAS